MPNASHIKLTCRESGLILKMIDSQKPFQSMASEAKESVYHFINCWRCNTVGLATIIRQSLTCQQAIEQWASAKNHGLWTSAWCNTLSDMLAYEHVYGHLDASSKNDGSVIMCEECSSRVCARFRNHWSQSGSSVARIGTFLPLAIRIFLEEGWPTNKLFEIQRGLLAELESLPAKSRLRIEKQEVILENLRGLQDIVRGYLSFAPSSKSR